MVTKQQWKAGYTPEDLKSIQENKLALIIALIIAIPMFVLFLGIVKDL